MKNKKKLNKNILKNFGGNFVLWILIIIISLTVLQFLTTNSKITYLTYKNYFKLIQSMNRTYNCTRI